MFEMFNLRGRANQILAGLWMLSWIVFMVAGVVLMLGGEKLSDLFNFAVILGSCATMAFFGGILMLLVAIQDCWKGETSYTAKGRLLKSDGVQQTYELLTKTAVRSESPWIFWTVVMAKGFAAVAIVAVSLVAWAYHALSGT